MEESNNIYIKKLVLNNFRNYDHLEILCENKSVILTGNNGAGKTNIIEAISLLVPGRGIRNHNLKEAINNNTNNQWTIFSSVNTILGPCNIGTSIDINTNTRNIRINRNNEKQQNLNNYLSCIWITPQMDRIFNNGSITRRRFLDKLITGYDKNHSIHLASYEKYIRSRRYILKSNKINNEWINIIESNIASYGVSIAASRILMVERLNNVVCKKYECFPSTNITIDGTIEHWLELYGANETEEMFRNSLQESRSIDSAYGGAYIGTHKTDIKVKHLDKNIDASMCSTGEQKAVLISIMLGNLKLQKAETSYMPILLLDEIAAHLDKNKLYALFNIIRDINPQTWYTGTDSSNFEPIIKDCYNFNIKNNKAILC